MSPRNLVAFFSMSGNTRALANEIRDLSFGHLEEIVEPRTRRGASGVLRAVFDTVLRRAPPIAPACRDPALYDLLILGGPVWMGRIAAPLRSYARKYGVRASQVAFFCTCGSGGASDAFRELATLCGRAPVAVLAVRANALAARSHEADLHAFVATTLGVPAAASLARADAMRPVKPGESVA